MKKGFKDNIEKLTEENNDFRKVIYTGLHSQLVLMALPVGGELVLKFIQIRISFFVSKKDKAKSLSTKLFMKFLMETES